jgi:hypothetical protein
MGRLGTERRTSMSHVLEARFRAIQQLQVLRAKHHPGSQRYEQIEHAIDLALSERRAVDDFLVRNLLRDARRILDRQAAARIYVQLEDGASPTEELLMESNTPEDILEAIQLAEAIVAHVSRSSVHAARVMEGLLVGESLAETAGDARISRARVNQLRQQLRLEVGSYLGRRRAR